VKTIEKDFDKVSAFASKVLDAHTASVLGAPTPAKQKFAFELTIGDEVCGGVTGKFMGEHLHISELVVKEAQRGKDLGSQLLVAMEKRGIEAGANVITVSTQCFQALDFYKKHDYEVFGELKDVPWKGVIKYYLTKCVEKSR